MRNKQIYALGNDDEQAALLALQIATLPIVTRYEYNQKIKVRTKPTKGGAYNCRKPKYKSKRRK